MQADTRALECLGWSYRLTSTSLNGLGELRDPYHPCLRQLVLAVRRLVASLTTADSDSLYVCPPIIFQWCRKNNIFIDSILLV